MNRTVGVTVHRHYFPYLTGWSICLWKHALNRSRLARSLISGENRGEGGVRVCPDGSSARADPASAPAPLVSAQILPPSIEIVARDRLRGSRFRVLIPIMPATVPDQRA